ncbi:30S ribosomal protein S6e [Candidatus Woesearchaeota archaeon]|nr:30S ribosomal protein S6e [Candidatus Woesearchaeota archaeon]
MADFKLVISDAKGGKSFQKEVKSPQADVFMGKNISEKVSGDAIGLSGFELQITGGSDFCGFPMRSGILGVRKKISLLGGVGFKGGLPGERRRKTVCGHKINESIVQINLKVVKQGEKNLADFFEDKSKAEPQAA